MTSKAKVYFIFSTLIVILVFYLDIVEARRRGRKFNDRNNPTKSKKPSTINIDGPIELVMSGVRVIVTSYLAIVF